MKKTLKIVLVLFILLIAVGAWVFFGTATGFSAKKEYLFIRTDAATKQAILDSLETNSIVTNKSAFSFLAGRLGYWEKIRPGRYEVTKGSSLLSIVRMLRNGQQSPVDLVITKLRTKEDFARFTGGRFEFDSSQMMQFLNNKDSMQQYGVDTATVFFNVLPNTYRYFWNVTPAVVYRKLYQAQKKFWNNDRLAQAKAIGLSPLEVYVLASIIEEETTNHKEKDTVASVYLNRLEKGMPLQADPTLKFAVRNFSLKRIAGEILRVQSPYNTYSRKGLPPGPICIPSEITIDAVLNPASTPYLYFVANRRLNGHLFSESFEEHVQKANLYRQQDRARWLRDSAAKANR